MSGGDVSGSKGSKSEPNVVPLCDILLVLLIIFMVVTPLIKAGVNVTLPEAGHTVNLPEPSQMISVSIKKDGTVWLESKEITDLGKLPVMIEDELEVKKQVDKTKILLRADGEVSYGRVTEVMDEIRRAQIEIVGLVTSDKVTSE